MSAETHWPAYLYDGQTAERRPVSVTLEPGGIRVHSDAEPSLLWPPGEFRQTLGSFSGSLIRIEYGDDPVQTLFVEQPGFVQALRRAYPRASVRVRSKSVYAAGIAIVSVVACALLYVFGANAAADWAAKRAPASWEAALGADVSERMAPPGRQCRDSAAVSAVHGVLDRLLQAAPPSPYKFKLAVVQDSSINAFAAPGGFVAVHSGLIGAAATPDELAGVLAHEAQHVLLRHSTRAILREVPLQLAISLLFGGSGIEGFASMAGSLGALSYRRDDEAEADREGMRLMHAAGMDGHAMVSFMRTLASKNADMPRLAAYVSSHPHTADRVATLERLAAAGPAPSAPAMDAAAWRHVQRVCGAGPSSLPSAP